MRNTGIFFLELLENTVFIPVIEIEVNRCIEHWGGFGKTVGINVGTNALMERIDQEIKGAGEIKQKTGEIVKQKKIVVKKEFGYPKLVFEEDSKHGEQRESEKSGEQPSTGCQMFGAFKEDYTMLEGSLGTQMLEDLFFPEEDWCFQDERVFVDPFWNHFLEGRG
ncbi:MAG: uncharacterized protein A8A55_2785 [Amphiamblys sp. WSBS2006]|nr:MAG: uncharacterized protein A8A55_2785 [Amphiamblys sp. WSBS2006]